MAILPLPPKNNGVPENRKHPKLTENNTDKLRFGNRLHFGYFDEDDIDVDFIPTGYNNVRINISYLSSRHKFVSGHLKTGQSWPVQNRPPG